MLIIRNAYSYDFGGGERFPVALAEELRNNGFSSIIITRSPKLYDLAQKRAIAVKKGWWWQYQNFSGLRTLLFPLYLGWQLLLLFWYIAQIIRFHPQTVHPQSRDDFIAATFAGKLCGKRVVWTDHADLKYIWQNHTVWYKNPVGKLVYAASKYADHITLVSHNEQRLIEQALKHPLAKKYLVIHNGVNEQPTSPIKRDPKDKKAIIFVATSRLVEAKGISELLTAFKRLAETTDARLWLLGEGPEEKRFKKQAESIPGVSFLGFPANALDYVAEADVFVHPSYNEGFSLSLVEAAMLGKPIIACNVGGNPEIVTDGENGCLVPVRDAQALYNAMLDLAAHLGKRKKYGDASRQIYQKRFVFSDIVKERFLPLYEM